MKCQLEDCPDTATFVVLLDGSEYSLTCDTHLGVEVAIQLRSWPKLKVAQIKWIGVEG